MIDKAHSALDRSSTFARQAIGAACVAFVAAFVGCIGLIAALLAAALSLLAIAARALAGVAVIIVRAACVGVCVFGAAWAFAPVWSSYGGDVAALLPAACIVIAPVAFVIGARASWGGLAMAGGAALAIGAVLPALPAEARVLALVGVIGGAVFQSLTKGAIENGQANG